MCVGLCVLVRPPAFMPRRQQDVLEEDAACETLSCVFRRSTWRGRAARGEDVQSDAVGSGRQAELLPLEVKVPSLPLLVAHADAVGDGQRQRVGLLSDVQQLQLVEQRSPGRDVGLSAGEGTHSTQLQSHSTTLLSTR